MQAFTLQARLNGLHEAAGFAAVMDMMRECGRPAVGHNALLDLAYTLESFAAPLPDSWSSFKRLAQHWFPGAVPTPSSQTIPIFLLVAKAATVLVEVVIVHSRENFST